MNFKTLTIIQIVQIFSCYTFSIMVIPSLIWSGYLRGKRIGERFLFSTVTGNFVIINATLMLSLAGIMNFYTLFLSTFVLAFIIYYLLHIKTVNIKLGWYVDVMSKMLGNPVIFKMYRNRMGCWFRDKTKSLIKRILEHLKGNAIETGVLLACLVMCVVFLTKYPLNFYGYGISDLQVHNAWINDMIEGNIFDKGIYPMGMHSIIVFIYTIFGIDTFYIVRLFGVVQGLYIFAMAWIFMRYLFRSQGAALFGFAVFTLTSVIKDHNVLGRWQFTLPQECSLIFLFPAFIYLLMFLRLRIQEIKAGPKDKAEKKQKLSTAPSSYCLLLFSLSVALTIEIHPFVTIAVAIFCLTVAFVYLPMILHKNLIFRLIAMGLVGLILGGAYIGIGLAQGKQLQGSFMWAAGVASESSEEKAAAELEMIAEKDMREGDWGEYPWLSAIGETSLPESKLERLGFAFKYLGTMLMDGAFNDGSDEDSYFAINPSSPYYRSPLTTAFVLAPLFILMLSGVFIVKKALWKRRKTQGDFSKIAARFYVREWVALWVYVILLNITHNSGVFSIPDLMGGRAITFLLYILPVFFCLPIDSIYRLFEGSEKAALYMRRLIIIGVLGFALAIKPLGISRDMSTFWLMEYNAGVQMVYDAIENYPDNTWTIVSNSEGVNQVWSHGSHYELIKLVLMQENYNSKMRIYIPTKYVFFVIEKKLLPFNKYIDLNDPQLGDDRVSAEIARQPLNFGDNMREDIARQRGNIISKAYYWSEEFKKFYPNEFKVYYEDDECIIYRLEQDQNFSYNFAIDYGFNSLETEE